jgi:hypothetical protein
LTDLAQLLFIGLPGSGKTTFLAALWHVLAERGDTTSLKLRQTGEDRTYLNQVAKAWRDCSQVPRTNLQTEQVVLLHLSGSAIGDFDLTVPDLSGEAFEQQLTDRRMTLRHDDLLREATGVMVFVHPDVQKGSQLTQAVQLAAAIGSTQDDDGLSAGSITPWSVEKLPTQVKLVELLQFVMERAQREVRLALVISAWDLIDSLVAPHEFLSRELPLLRQFLDTNEDLLEHAVFGVSAQGGDITDPEKKEALLKLDDALRRIKVRQGGDTSNDITKPIAWLLGGN